MRKLVLVCVLFLGFGGFGDDARAQFCPGVSPWVFDDVPASDPFCGFITKMAEQNVTLGCLSIDANHRLFCPEDAVTRKQMAAFLGRLGDALLPLTCASGQVLKWNGSAWACASDNGGGGTVTSLSQGNGIALSANPITTTGSIAVDTATIQARVTGSCTVGSYVRAIAADGSVTCQADNAGPANAFVEGGNAFVTAVLGTTSITPLDIRVSNIRVMRYEPVPPVPFTPIFTPNVIGGNVVNNVTAGVRGAAIGGGGAGPGSDPDFPGEGPNRVTDAYGTVGGGYSNRAGDAAGTTNDAGLATVGGGGNNIASALQSTIGGGASNEASGVGSTVAGGIDNAADGYASSVVGGASNDATGDYSVAMGRRARALGNGAFAFADSNNFDFGSFTDNAFRVRATGGVRFVTGIDGAGGITWSCLTSDGNGWSCASDRNLKQDLAALDGAAVLDKLVAMPVYAWSPKGRSAHIRHYGPMAQDFMSAFGLGDDETMIGMQDADGVALAAIQGLNAKLEARIAEQDSAMAELRAQAGREIAELRRTVEMLLARTAPPAEVTAGR